MCNWKADSEFHFFTHTYTQITFEKRWIHMFPLKLWANSKTCIRKESLSQVQVLFNFSKVPWGSIMRITRQFKNGFWTEMNYVRAYSAIGVESERMNNKPVHEAITKKIRSNISIVFFLFPVILYTCIYFLSLVKSFM